MNTIVFNKLSSQVLFEEKATEVEMSSRNYLEVIDGQHPDLLSSNQVIRDNQAMRHRRNGYVEHASLFKATCVACVNMRIKWSPVRNTAISWLFRSGPRQRDKVDSRYGAVVSIQTVCLIMTPY